MEDVTKLKDTLAPLTDPRRRPLRARLAHLSFGAAVVDEALKVAAANGYSDELSEASIERALDAGAARKISAEIGSGDHPLVNANPGFGAAMLLGICIAVAAGEEDFPLGEDSPALPVLVGALSCQHHLDRYRADLARHGLADNNWDYIPGRAPEAGEVPAIGQLESWLTVDSARQDR